MTRGLNIRIRWVCLAAVLAAAGLAVAATAGRAESDKAGSGLFKGLTQNRQDPVRISADTLEVRDKQKKATFSGDVHVVQGETDVRCHTLIVHYEGELGKSGPKGQPGQSGSSGNQQIRRMEARGAVTVTQKDQRAVGDAAEFDMRKQVVTLTGNVIVTRGEDVLRGHSLFIDLQTGVSRMESGGGRVEGMFKSNASGQGQPRLPGRPN